MKKFIVSVFYTAVMALALLLAGCGSEKKEAGESAAPAAAKVDIWEQSTLNKILKNKVLRVGLEAGYMPFELKDKSGNIVGFDVDIAKMMAEDMGVKLELVNTAWDGIIPALLTDKFDIIMSGMTITPQRNLQVNFCDPYIVVGQTIFVKKDLEGKITSYKDLDDPKYTIATKLGVTADYASKKYMGKANIKLYETEQEGAMEVLNGKADAFVYDLPYNAIFYAQNKEKLGFIDEPFTYEPLAWAVRKGDPDFVNFLNNYLAQIKGDGRYQATYDKWFGSTDWLKDIQ
ncbi:transporter substrate-binding domain-containing protein [Seleniivibrio woodruffii]|uniref:Amino acid ABC transporter substrate-binding protein (PAAT family) n=1 Tax=Seleniivibrio woodruffii TaxID=1078050 RepID=A0A4R1KDH6_9BACT|nr:transporter substrate-binding domain-containing protein [Seleniivibrio woodruffii]TCK62622.1 amino acid ABC transporter substrate-binding protein (PAAT family) [Seleniivibrio woodruffii]TVZ36952.1 amino acid ABC transporter substrate-binding protein (PAAT family) [Seleniivibrio woodruffii]